MKMTWEVWRLTNLTLKQDAEAYNVQGGNIRDRHCRIATVTLKEGWGGGKLKEGHGG